MRYDPPLLEVTLLKRYKRFLADVSAEALPEGVPQLADEEPGCFTVHCANPGSMSGLAVPGARAWVQDSGNPKRKLRYSLELIETSEGAHVCVNTARANHLVAEALQEGLISEVAHYTHRAEVKWSGADHETGAAIEARFDFALDASSCDEMISTPPKGYLEVKSVTYAPDPVLLPGRVAFPDAVTKRGLKHLRALSAVALSGQRAVLLFCVNRDDAREVTIAEEIDPAYAQGLRDALKAGVEVFAYRANATQSDHCLTERIPFIFT